MKIDTGGPAVPMPEHLIDAVDEDGKNLRVLSTLMGKTWLDECAMRAMQGIRQATGGISFGSESDEIRLRVADDAYKQAIAMLNVKRRLEAGE